METYEFWLLMAATHARSGGITDRQARLLVSELAALGPEAVLEFEKHLDHFVRQAYDRRHSPDSAFGRAEIFGDDSLRDFIVAVIVAGEEVYYKILGTSCRCEIESVYARLGSGEPIDLVAMYAYFRATGLPHPYFDEGDYDEGHDYLLGEDGAQADPQTPASPICDAVAA